MSRTAPFWSVASLISEAAEPLEFLVSLEDMVSGTGQLVDRKLSHYSADGTPFSVGDVLFGKLRPYLAKYWFADRAGTAGGDIHVYRPSEEVEPRFLKHVVGSPDFVKYAEAVSKGTKMPRAEWMGLHDFFKVPFDVDLFLIEGQPTHEALKRFGIGEPIPCRLLVGVRSSSEVEVFCPAVAT